MNGVEDLVAKVIASLTVATGKRMIDGLKRICNRNIVIDAQRLTENPDDEKVRKKLVDELRKVIEESPSLAQNLREVLPQSQSATLTGSCSTIIQVQGHNNRT